MADQNSEPIGTNGTTMNVETDSVASVVQEVWSSMLGMGVDGASENKATTLGTSGLSGSVRFRGGWDGAVFLDCSSELARTMAAGMFGTQPDDLTTEEIHDALGELVNIIGGNLKHLLPPPCQLQLPAVHEEEHPDRATAPGRLVTEVGFTCDSETFRVSLVESQVAADVKDSGARREA